MRKTTKLRIYKVPVGTEEQPATIERNEIITIKAIYDRTDQSVVIIEQELGGEERY